MNDADLALMEALVRSSADPWPPREKWTREDLLKRLDGAVCKGNVNGVAVIEPVSGGTIWTPQRDVDALIAEGALTEVSDGAVTRLVRPSETR